MLVLEVIFVAEEKLNEVGEDDRVGNLIINRERFSGEQ